MVVRSRDRAMVVQGLDRMLVDRRLGGTPVVAPPELQAATTTTRRARHRLYVQADRLPALEAVQSAQHTLLSTVTPRKSATPPRSASHLESAAVTRPASLRRRATPVVFASRAVSLDRIRWAVRGTLSFSRGVMQADMLPQVRWGRPGPAARPATLHVLQATPVQAIAVVRALQADPHLVDMTAMQAASRVSPQPRASLGTQPGSQDQTTSIPPAWIHGLVLERRIDRVVAATMLLQHTAQVVRRKSLLVLNTKRALLDREENLLAPDMLRGLLRRLVRTILVAITADRPLAMVDPRGQPGSTSTPGRAPVTAMRLLVSRSPATLSRHVEQDPAPVAHRLVPTPRRLCLHELPSMLGGPPLMPLSRTTPPSASSLVRQEDFAADWAVKRMRANAPLLPANTWSKTL